MKNHSKNYLHFSKVERNGLLLLLLLFIVFLSIPWLSKSNLPDDETDFSAFKTEAAIFAEAITSKEQQTKNQLVTAYKRPTIKKNPKSEEKEPFGTATSLFQFDPNTVSKEDLVRLGFRSKVAKRWVNYRLSGATFYDEDDVAKIYGLDKAHFNKAIPFMVFAPKPSKAKQPPKVKNGLEKHKSVTTVPIRKKTDPIAVNAAGIAEWQKLYGIGPVLSERIVKFRDRLGGFTSITQLQEVYGLPDSTFLGIEPLLILDEPAVSKLDINMASKEELAKHPYLKWKQANIIVNYREQHGPYTSREDLYKLRGVPKEQLDKILPYLKFSYD